MIDINKKLRVNTRTLGYAVQDLVTCSVIILLCLVAYPFWSLYVNYIAKNGS